MAEMRLFYRDPEYPAQLTFWDMGPPFGPGHPDYDRIDADVRIDILTREEPDLVDFDGPEDLKRADYT